MKSMLLLLVIPAALGAQTIEGGVFDAVTGAPLVGAAVSTNNGNDAPVVRTDAAGHFQLQGRKAMALASKAGYLPGNVRVLPGGPSQIRIELKPESVVYGKVVDEDGFPVNRASVEAMRIVQGPNGKQVMGNRGVQTDDQGNYRLETLEAGKYYILVRPGDAGQWDRRYMEQFLGGTPLPDDSHALEIKTGEIHKDTDIHLVKIDGVTVSGKVEGVPAGPGGILPVQLSHTISLGDNGSYQTTSGFSSTVTTSGSTTTFEFRHVPPGKVTLHYGNGQGQAGDLEADMTLEVGTSDMRDLVLSPQPLKAFDLEGQVAVREGGLPGDWVVNLRGRRAESHTVHVNEDGTFAIKGLVSGRYNLQAMPPRIQPAPNVLRPYVVSTMVGDQETRRFEIDLDGSPKPLKITVSSLYAVVTGVLVDSRGQAVTNTPLMFLSDQGDHRGGAMTDAKGAFHAQMTDPGNYHVYVATDPQQLNDSDYLQAHSGDFPLIHAVLGTNAPVALQVKAPAGQ